MGAIELPFVGKEFTHYCIEAYDADSYFDQAEGVLTLRDFLNEFTTVSRAEWRIYRNLVNKNFMRVSDVSTAEMAFVLARSCHVAEELKTLYRTGHPLNFWETHYTHFRDSTPQDESLAWSLLLREMELPTPEFLSLALMCGFDRVVSLVNSGFTDYKMLQFALENDIDASLATSLQS